VNTATGLRRAVLITAATSLAMLLAPIARAATPVELEVCFLDHINAARATNGAPAMVMSPSLSEYGRTHSDAMASEGILFHSTPAQLNPVLPDGWQAWGENVGYATGSEDCSWLFEGFWESPNHQANLLNPIFDTAGIGVIVDGSDTIWTTHVFVQTAGSSPPTTTLPPTTTSTTTTTPATTTTTQVVATTSATTTTPAITTTTQVVVTTSATTASTAAVSDGTTSSSTTAHDAEVAPVIGSVTDSEVAIDEADPIVGETIAAGIDPACPEGCPQTKIYAMFLVAVAFMGGAISWWAFRS